MAVLSPFVAPLQTPTLFLVTPKSHLSPLDELIENTNRLNALAAQQQQFTRELGALLLLGHTSAVESFIRSLICAVIELDEVARKRSEPHLLPFGAAMSHERERMAEALLEGISFASRSNVVDGLKDFLGVSDTARTIGPILDEFQRICELRHCCVHRFGKLGAKNAIALGLHEHKGVLEAPLNLSRASIDEIALRLRTFAKSLNNVVCERVMDRTVRNKDDHGRQLYSSNWTWNWQRDRRRFTAYYRIFATALDSIRTQDARVVYDDFRSEFRSP